MPLNSSLFSFVDKVRGCFGTSFSLVVADIGIVDCVLCLKGSWMHDAEVCFAASDPSDDSLLLLDRISCDSLKFSELRRDAALPNASDIALSSCAFLFFSAFSFVFHLSHHSTFISSKGGGFWLAGSSSLHYSSRSLAVRSSPQSSSLDLRFWLASLVRPLKVTVGT